MLRLSRVQSEDQEQSLPVLCAFCENTDAPWRVQILVLICIQRGAGGVGIVSKRRTFKWHAGRNSAGELQISGHQIKPCTEQSAEWKQDPQNSNSQK